MQYIHELTDFYKSIYKECVELAILPVTFGISFGFVVGGIIAGTVERVYASIADRLGLLSSRRDTITSDNTFPIGWSCGMAVGACLGVPFLTTTVPVAIVLTAFWTLTTLITYPVAFALDLCSAIYSLCTSDNHHSNSLSMG